MKKRWLILFSSLLALSLCGCSSSVVPDSENTELTASDSEAAPTVDDDTIRGLMGAAEGSGNSGDYSLVDGHLYKKDKPVNTESTRLEISGAQLGDYSFLSEFTKLEYLRVTGSDISDLTPLTELPALSELIMEQCTAVSSFDALSQLTGLSSLVISDSPINDISFLSGLTGLVSLDLFGVRDTVDFAVLQGLPELRSLSLSFDKNQDLSQLAKLTQLEAFKISSPDAVDISFLSEMKNLTFLSISIYSSEGMDLSPLSNLTKLETLHLWAAPNPFYGSMDDLEPIDISPLENLTSMKILTLTINVADCSPIANMTELEMLDFRTANNVDASIFTQLSHLQILDFTSGGTTNIPALAQADMPDLERLMFKGTEEDEKLLKDAFPSCDVFVCPADDT